MKVIGTSLIDGEMVQCESCNTVYPLNKYSSCPYCSLRRISWGEGRAHEGWTHIRRSSNENDSL